MALLVVVQAIIGASVAVRLITLKIPLPFWCVFLLFESVRQAWIVLRIGPPDSLLYGAAFEKTEPLSMAVLLVASAEVFFKAASFYAGAKRVSVYVFAILILVGATVAIATCFGPQAGIEWANLPLRNLLLTHQLVYGTITFCMLLMRLGFALAPNSSAVGYRKHTSLLALFVGYDSFSVLVSNMRLITGSVIVPLLIVGTMGSLSLWFFLKKEDFRTTQAPHDPDRRNRLMRVLQTLKKLRDPFRGPRSKPPTRQTLIQH